MKLLIAGPDSLGEVVCSTALLRCIKEQLTGVELHYWCPPQWAAAVRFHPAVDQLLLSEQEPQIVPGNSYNALIDLKPARQLRQWARQAGIPYFSYAATFLVSFLSEHFGLYSSAGNHITDRFFEAVKPLGVFNDEQGPAYFLSPQDEVPQADIPTAHSAGYIALVAGEHDYDKPIPMALLEACCRQIQFPIILVSSRGSNLPARQLAAIDPVKIYNACGKFSLNETADLVRRARLVLTPETGLMQVAAAFDRPMIVWRSSGQVTPLFPPCYAARPGRVRQTPRFSSLIWPEQSLGRWRSRPAKEQEPPPAAVDRWVQQAMKLIQELLAAKSNS